MRYKPTILREREVPPQPVKYGVGIEDSPGSFGMIHGPFDTVEECLEEVGSLDEEDKLFVLECPLGKKLWKWNVEDQEWEQL